MGNREIHQPPEATAPVDLSAKAHWSLNRALWDMVTPDLRGIAMSVTAAVVRARFLYEVLGEIQRELTSEVETEVVADLGQWAEIEFTAVELAPDVQRTLEPGEEWVFLRRELGEVVHAPVLVGTSGNLSLVHDSRRRFPGLLVQGDTLWSLLEDLEEELPDGLATRTLRAWVSTYEQLMSEAGRGLPYVPRPGEST